MEFETLPPVYKQEVMKFFLTESEKKSDDQKETKLKDLSKEKLQEKKQSMQEMLDLMKFEIDYLKKKKELYKAAIKEKDDKKEDSGKESGDDSD